MERPICIHQPVRMNRQAVCHYCAYLRAMNFLQNPEYVDGASAVRHSSTKFVVCAVTHRQLPQPLIFIPYNILVRSGLFRDSESQLCAVFHPRSTWSPFIKDSLNCYNICLHRSRASCTYGSILYHKLNKVISNTYFKFFTYFNFRYQPMKAAGLQNFNRTILSF